MALRSYWKNLWILALTEGESLIRKMATAEQVQQMIDLMKAQMEQVTKLQTENAELRNAMRGANEGHSVKKWIFLLDPEFSKWKSSSTLSSEKSNMS